MCPSPCGGFEGKTAFFPTEHGRRGRMPRSTVRKKDSPMLNNRAVRCRKLGSERGVEWAGWSYFKSAATLTLLQLRSDALTHVGIGRHRFHDLVELIDLQT